MENNINLYHTVSGLILRDHDYSQGMITVIIMIIGNLVLSHKFCFNLHAVFIVLCLFKVYVSV